MFLKSTTFWFPEAVYIDMAKLLHFDFDKDLEVIWEEGSKHQNTSSMDDSILDGFYLHEHVDQDVIVLVGHPSSPS